MAGTDWEERITSDTNPGVRIEHEVRYRFAAPLIREAPVWCDLGCGNGLAAASALDGPISGRAVLIDFAEHVLRQAEREIEAAAVVTLQADLTSDDELRSVRDALAAEGGAGGCVTCFEVIEHLSTFVPLVETLVELAERHDFTVALSVPNDAFWSIENPFHQTMWGEGAFEELRRLLPADHVVGHQFALQGSLAVREREPAARHTVEFEAPAGAAPTHFLVGLGPSAPRLTAAAAVGEADLVERRRWERERESDLAFLKSLEAELTRSRSYIRELEGRLGQPVSSAGRDDSA
jgi:hypothetical protein